MNKEVEIICELSGCSVEDGVKAWEEFGNIVDAVDKLLPGKKPVPKKPKKISEDQEKFNEIRKLCETMDEIKTISSNQSACEGQVEQLNHHEEMALRNNCSQQCQLPSLEAGVQKQETVCPSQSGCSYDLPLNDQK